MTPRLAVAIALPVALALVGGIFLIWKYAHASGKVEYCYLRYDEPNRMSWGTNVLMGHREWRSDVEYGTFIEVQEAVDRAFKMGCPFRVME